jgi:membrane protease YdiL (CAAX protease family)
MRSRRAALLYVLLSVGFSSLYWLIGTLAPEAMKRSEWAVVSAWGTVAWALLRAFGPAVAGILTLAIVYGREAVVELGRSILRWRVSPRLYLLGLFPFVINVVVVLTGYAVGSYRLQPQLTIAKALMMFFLMALLDGPLGEEVGWRGVMLPQLLKTIRPLPAAVLVGIVWYVWHVPLYALDGKGMTVWEHVLFAVACIALSIILTWFFLKSNASTFLAIYLHNCSNFFTFVRFKTFATIAPSPWPRTAYYVVLLTVTACAAVAQSREAWTPGVEAGNPANSE